VRIGSDRIARHVPFSEEVHTDVRFSVVRSINSNELAANSFYQCKGKMKSSSKL